MNKVIKNNLLKVVEEMYESSKETIGDVLEMDIEDLDYYSLEYESALIIQLAELVEDLNEAEMNNELDYVEDKLDFRFIKDEFENKDELRKFLQSILCEPNIDLDDLNEVIDNIVKLIFK